MSWLVNLLLLLFGLIWIVGGVFITKASLELSGYRGRDSDLSNAYWYAFTAGFLTWTLIGILLVALLAWIFGFFDSEPSFRERAERQTFSDRISEEEITEQGGTQVRTLTVQRNKKKKTGLSTWAKWMLVISLIMVTLVGILSALTADSIHASSESKEGSLQQAYDDAILSASLALGSVGLLGIAAISYEGYDYYQTRHKSD